MIELTDDISQCVFGTLKVIQKWPLNSLKNKIQYICLCKCGEYFICSKEGIINGDIRSCGCKSHFAKGNKSEKWKGFGKISKHIFNKIKRSACERHHEFNVTIEYLWEIFLKQEGRCALSGLEIEFSSSNRKSAEKTASLDRIDNLKGYIKENVQWVHKDVNRMKSTLTQKRFKDLCKLIGNI